MALQKAGRPSHTGGERYEVTLKYTFGDLEGIARLTKPGAIITDTVVLVWVRSIGEKWRRCTRGTYGSRAIGHVKGEFGDVGSRKSREIFTTDLGDIRPWAQYLPGLRSVIGDVESDLPE